MDYSTNHLSNEDRLFMTTKPPPVFSLTVVGGRVVASSHGQIPDNGQQFMTQLDSLTSAMMDMAVNREKETKV